MGIGTGEGAWGTFNLAAWFAQSFSEDHDNDDDDDDDGEDDDDDDDEDDDDDVSKWFRFLDP